MRGDVLGAEAVKVEQGATIGGDVRQDVAFTPRGSLSVLGALLGGAAIAFSTLLVGLLLLLLAPRGADRVASAARSAPIASVGWGIVLAIGLPLLAVLAAATIVGLPLGLSLLLALGLRVPGGGDVVHLVGGPRAGSRTAIAVARVPRRVGDRARGEPGALLNLAVWDLASVLGLGAALVAIWRARGSGAGGGTG